MFDSSDLTLRCTFHVFLIFSIFFFFNDTATTEIYTLSLHDALPISGIAALPKPGAWMVRVKQAFGVAILVMAGRSEEHTSELQSQSNLVCRLLLEKKKKKKKITFTYN